ncbi:hypothetical protein C8R43DRAFT_1024086 [Mycena crocata]|nr:hypothetical protein C8R43DRAFT_1024086 [Mycena crocata]
MRTTRSVPGFPPPTFLLEIQAAHARPDTDPVRCHRCKVLPLECSYEPTHVPLAVKDPATTLSGSTEASQQDFTPDDTLSHHRLLTLAFITPPTTEIDWSTPMPVLAIQQLTTIPTSKPSVPESMNSDLALSTILPEERINYLIQLFDTNYTPWLNFHPIRNSPNPLVDIVCAEVAAWHLEGIAGRDLRLRLQNLTQDSIAQMVFAPQPADSLEAVQCLIIFSLWGPFGDTPETQRWDAQVLISAAVRIAIHYALIVRRRR